MTGAKSGPRVARIHADDPRFPGRTLCGTRAHPTKDVDLVTCKTCRLYIERHPEEFRR